MLKKIPEFISNLLNEFFNHKSDASPMEASVQENMENEFKIWLENRDYLEEDALSVINTMCEESLSPNIFLLWEIVLRKLYNTRIGLKHLMIPSSLSKDQKYPELSQERLDYLQKILSFHHESGSVIPAEYEVVEEVYSSIVSWLLKE